MKVFRFWTRRAKPARTGWQVQAYCLIQPFFLEYVRKRDGGLQTAVMEPVVKRRLLDLEEVEFLGNAG